LSRKLADRLGVDYSLIAREVRLPHGTRIAAARTTPITLNVAGSQKDLTVVAVDMIGFKCILGLPWLDAANAVVNWRNKKLLLPGTGGPTEVDLNRHPCRSRVSNVSSLSTAQLLKIGKKEARCTWPPFALHLK
jgi:hypothetical protein